MKRQFFPILLVLCMIAVSCKNKASNEQTENKDRDTVFIILHLVGQSISGKLNFMAYESDSRIGTITSGKMNGDTLFAQYNSAQEGMVESDCEIALLKKDSTYVLSNDFYGSDNYQFNADNTKGTFKDKRHIKFDGVVLKKIANDSIKYLASKLY